MNPDLENLHPYPFEKLARLKADSTPPEDKAHIALSIGEPRHTTPSFIAEEVITHLHKLSSYPATRGQDALREAMSEWLIRRFRLHMDSIDPDRNVLPVNGTREGLFAFAQCVVNRSDDPIVMMPNPFYQIYEGAALLAGAEPWYLNTLQRDGFIPDFDAVPEAVWQRCQLLYLCSPGNPAGAVLDEAALEKVIHLADRYDFIIASDECYSEIYLDEPSPPTGLLEVAHRMGRDDFHRCAVFHSLSKRSNAPGLRSGFVAGDAKLIAPFLHYRTYHGCAMPPHNQAGSLAAWRDEHHVVENRALYREKFQAVLRILEPVLPVEQPAGGFYLWPEVPVDDTEFARDLYARQHVTVLPGSYLSRVAAGVNPGERRVRMALVAPLDECVEAAERIADFVSSL